MSYTPINWQTGDTITAEKMNKMDNGWGVSATQLFSETVTTATASGEPAPVGTLAYSGFITEPSIVVTFDGTDYTVQITEGFANIYGEIGQGGPSFANYPFCLVSVDGGPNMIYTETAGTYTVAVTTSALAVGDSFKTAVQTAGSDAFASVDTLPYIVVIGETTFADVWEAATAGRPVYRRNYYQQDSSWRYFYLSQISFTNLTVTLANFESGTVITVAYSADSTDDLLH